MDAKKTGKTILFLRTQRGITQRELAEEIGVSDKAVSKWERGVGGPDISLLSRLAIALDVDIESLLEGNLTHLELKCKGVLILDYPDGIHADCLLFDKPAVYLQLSYFLLVGIREIEIWGKSRDVDFLEMRLGDGRCLGASFLYHDVKVLRNQIWWRNVWDLNEKSGVLLIKGLDFIFGKDLTKTMRRILYDSKEPVCLTANEGQFLSLYYYPSNTAKRGEAFFHLMERGTIAYSIRNVEDFLDTSNLIQLIQKKTGKKIADLREIAENRGFIV